MISNVLVWASTRTFANVGFTATLWAHGITGFYVGFSAGMGGQEAASRYAVAAPEIGVKLGGPRLYLSAGWAMAAGNDFGGGHSRVGMMNKLLLTWQPLHHFGVFGGMASFSPIGTAQGDNQFGVDGILGVQF